MQREVGGKQHLRAVCLRTQHEGGRKKGDAYQTPAPGHYAITKKHDVKFKASPTPQFGGNLCQISREKTGAVLGSY